MITVPVVHRPAIDGWPVEEAGLPARGVHCCERIGIRTVGELRGWKAEDLLKLRSFGVRTLKQTRTFFRLCRRLEEGSLEFENLKAMLAEFLLPAQIHVLTRRYGLHRSDAGASRDCETLQEIASDHNLTRERVRQTEAAGLARLRSRLPLAYLQPILDAAIAFLASRGRAVTASEVMVWSGSGIFAPYNPASALLMLADAHPGRICSLDSLFTLTRQDTLAAIEQRARAGLAAAGGPVSVDPVIEHLGASLVDEMAADRHVMLPRILAHMKNVLATRDGRFLLDRHADRLVADILAGRQGGSLHFEHITGLLNECLDERSALSSTQVLMRMNRSDKFERVERGHYRLRGPPPTTAQT